MWLLRIGISCIKLSPYPFRIDLKNDRRHWNFRCCLFSKTSDDYLSQFNILLFSFKVLLCVFFDYSKFQSRCYPKRGLGKYWIEFQSEELFLKGVHGTRLWGQVTKKLFWKRSDHFATSWRWESKMWDTLGAWRASF